jgi:HAD superfamily hydrolase (TIGR01509 family)
VSQDIAVLNCALTLERLGADFYITGLQRFGAADFAPFGFSMLVDCLRDICATSEMIGRTATERERWRSKYAPPAEASESHALRNCIARHRRHDRRQQRRPRARLDGCSGAARTPGRVSSHPSVDRYGWRQTASARRWRGQREPRRTQDLRDARDDLRKPVLAILTPTPGARRFVEWLNKVGVIITIATSAKAQEVTGLLSAAGVDDLIAHAATSDDADASKPDPDIVVAALKKSGSERDKAIMIGDTPYDIEAATRAGVQTIAFRTGGWPDGALRGAVAIFDDPDDLVGHLADSPFAGTAT